jgi:hypothetical protein
VLENTNRREPYRPSAARTAAHPGRLVTKIANLASCTRSKTGDRRHNGAGRRDSHVAKGLARGGAPEKQKRSPTRCTLSARREAVATDDEMLL